MKFEISTVRRAISALVLGVVLLAGMAAPAEAQGPPGRRGSHSNNGRHLGWTRGQHRGWDNYDTNRTRRVERRAYRRSVRDDWRTLRQHQRAERRTFRATGDRVGMRDLSRHQRLERREFRTQQRVNRHQFKH
jgi:Spy/CpxP family protein refolding chaperone